MVVVVTKARFVKPPVQIGKGLEVTNVSLFVERALADLVIYVKAVNNHREDKPGIHWMESLWKEKVEQLKLCGMDVEIY